MEKFNLIVEISQIEKVFEEIKAGLNGGNLINILEPKFSKFKKVFDGQLIH